METQIADRIERSIGQGPEPRPSLEELLAEGRRAVRRRNLAWGSASAVAVAVIGVGASMLSGGADDHAGKEFVGHPTATASPSGPATDVTDPGQSADPPTTKADPGAFPGIPADMVAFVGATEQLSPGDGVTILEQRPHVRLGGSFAGAQERTAAALVRTGGGDEYYVLARTLDGEEQQDIAVPLADGGADLDAFLDFARERYASGAGLL